MTSGQHLEPAEPPDEYHHTSADADAHEGSEDDPPRTPELSESGPLPPVRYAPAEDLSQDPARGGPVSAEAGDSAVLTHSSTDPTTMDRLVAASGPIALITFFLIGFGLGAWYIAWVVFLIPGALHAWNRPPHRRP